MPIQRPHRTPAEQEDLDQKERRQFWIIAATFAIALVGLTGLYVVVSNQVQPTSPTEGAALQVDKPAFPIPDGGSEAADPGERGGTGQLALLGGILVVFGGGAAWLVHSSRKARRHHQHQPPSSDDASDDAVAVSGGSRGD